MKVKKFGGALAAACALLAVGSAAAQTTLQFAKAEDAIQYRQSAFQVLKYRFGVLGPIVKGQAPYDKENVIKDVQILSEVAQLPWAGFVEGSEGGNAKPNVWSDQTGFEEAREVFLTSLVPLQEAADGGNMDELRAAFAKTGASCKACHDAFRK